MISDLQSIAPPGFSIQLTVEEQFYKTCHVDIRRGRYHIRISEPAAEIRDLSRSVRLDSDPFSDSSFLSNPTLFRDTSPINKKTKKRPRATSFTNLSKPSSPYARPLTPSPLRACFSASELHLTERCTTPVKTDCSPPRRLHSRTSSADLSPLRLRIVKRIKLVGHEQPL